MPTVQTDTGLVSGMRVFEAGKQVDAFLGIPYAEPPVGDLRFRRPQPKAPWVGTFNASSKPAPCWQIPLQFSNHAPLNYSSSASEDCLYLNVWRPVSECSIPSGCSVKRPVVVFIHGGGYQWGDSALFLYDASNFVALSDVVFVSFNYRLSILGFLSLETPELPGNMGLWDQHLVLKWVQRNIRNFGGDPDQVTLSGQSAGGISAGLHAASPHSRGLFQRIITESGTPLSMILGITYRGVSKFAGITRALGCYDDGKDIKEQVNSVLTCLRKLSASTIYATLEAQDEKGRLFAPIHGDDFMPNHPLSEETWKDLKLKEILLGTVSNEGSLFFEHIVKTYPSFASILSVEYRLPVTVALSQMFDVPLPKARAIVDWYFGDYDTQHDSSTVRRIMSEIFADSVFNCPTQLFGDLTASQGIATYRFVFAHRSSHSLWPEWMGVAHGDGMLYNLGSLVYLNDRSKYTEAVGTVGANYLSQLNYTSEENDFMMQIVRTWSNFIKNGIPTIDGSHLTDLTDLSDFTVWPKYTAENPQILFLRPNNFSTALDQGRKVCELWRPFLLHKHTRSASTTARPPGSTGLQVPPPPRRKPEINDNSITSGGPVTSGPLSLCLVACCVLARVT